MKQDTHSVLFTTVTPRNVLLHPPLPAAAPYRPLLVMPTGLTSVSIFKQPNSSISSSNKCCMNMRSQENHNVSLKHIHFLYLSLNTHILTTHHSVPRLLPWPNILLPLHNRQHLLRPRRQPRPLLLSRLQSQSHHPHWFPMWKRYR